MPTKTDKTMERLKAQGAKIITELDKHTARAKQRNISAASMSSISNRIRKLALDYCGVIHRTYDHLMKKA